MSLWEEEGFWKVAGGVFAFIATVAGAIWRAFKSPPPSSQPAPVTATGAAVSISSTGSNNPSSGINTTVNVVQGGPTTSAQQPLSSATETLDEKKKRTQILFIDDDSKFNVTRILQKSGWANTKTVKDIESLDDPSVKATDIFFVDIQGVGLKLGFRDQGLGLALAIKQKYPEKKVVIYSAQSDGDRFHEALRKVDDFISKNAEPYEFQTIIEKLS